LIRLGCVQPGRINAIANALKEAQAADDGELQRRTDFETARKSILARTEGDWLQVGPCSSSYLFIDDALLLLLLF
jgi:hypothetical protein